MRIDRIKLIVLMAERDMSSEASLTTALNTMLSVQTVM